MENENLDSMELENENTENTENPTEPPVAPDNPDTPDTPTDPVTPDEPTDPTEPDLSTWTYKDIDDFYNRVRMALGAVSETTIPDEYMDYPEKAPFAENYIKARVPKWQELDKTKFAIFESVIVYQTAIFFQSIVANKHIRKKSIPTITLEYSDLVDFNLNGMSLSDIVDWLVAQLNEEEDKQTGFIGFRVTPTKTRVTGGCCCGKRNYKR